jgi:16S rRNA (cytosine967-C5)-methyltransferase
LRLPARAAVHESVELARASRPQAAGFVNAVLRRLAREGGAPAPDPQSDPLGWLTSEGSLPRWLAERWLAGLGAETACARARALRERPEPVLRLNPGRPEALERAREAGLELQPLAVAGAHRVASGRPGPLAREGLLYVQDLGSQIAARLAARPGRVLDACAAPGGKALLLADAFGAGSTVVAAEAAPPRLRTLRALVERWGASNVRLVRADSVRPPFSSGFDGILLDAPCSGLGTLARHPDIRWRARAEDLRRHSGRQRDLLAALAPLVAPGGALVYAVCSLEPEETEEVVRDFLAGHSQFEVAPLPDWCERFRAGSFVRTLPERDGGDGFFVASLRRAVRATAAS